VSGFRLWLPAFVGQQNILMPKKGLGGYFTFRIGAFMV